MFPNSQHHAESFMIMAVTRFAVSGFFAKLSSHIASAANTTLVRFIVPIFILLVIALVTRTKIRLPQNQMRLLAIRGLAMTLAQFCFYYALSGLPLSESTALYNTGPLFVTAISWFLGQHIQKKTVYALLLCAVGVVLVCHIQEGVFNQYIFFGLLSGMCFAVSQMTFHKIAKAKNDLNSLLWLYAFSVMFAILISLFDGSLGNQSGIDLAEISLLEGVALLLIGACSLANQFWRGKAYSLSKSSSDLAPLVYFSVFISTVLDMLFFKFSPTLGAILGLGLIMTGAMVLYGKKKPAPALTRGC